MKIEHCAGLRDISFPLDAKGSWCSLFYWHFEKTKDNKYNNRKDYDGECLLFVSRPMFVFIVQQCIELC